MAGAPSTVPGTISTPNVFGPPQGITASRFYLAEVRLPQPNLPGAGGRATPENIRVSNASAGTLEFFVGADGLAHYFVRMNARPPEV